MPSPFLLLHPARWLRWPAASLRAYLVLVIVLATVPLAAFSLYLVQQLAIEARTEADDAVRRSARAFALLVERELSSSIDLLTGLAYNEALQRGDTVALHEHLQRGAPMRPGWRGVYLADLDGGIVFASDQPYGRPLGRLRDSTALEQIRSTLQPAVTDLVTVATTGEVVTGVQVPVIVGGHLRYVLGARIATSHWQQLVERTSVPPGGFLSVLDGHSRVVAHNLEPDNVGRVSAVDEQFEGLGARREGWLRLPWPDLPPLVARQPVPATRWIVGAGVPSGPLVLTQAGALASVLGAGLLSLLLGLVLAVTVARRATVPLRQLAEGGPLAVDEPVVVREIASLRTALLRASEQSEHARQELQRKADEFEALFSSSPVGLAMTLDSAGTRALINPALAAMLGTEAGIEDLRALLDARADSTAPVRMRRQGQSLPFAEQPMQKAGTLGTAIDADDLELVHRDGRHVDLEVHAVPLRDAEGAPRGAVAAFVDVSARRLVEQQRTRLMQAEQEARRAAEEANRGKDEFLAMLGHELRNPLGAVGAAAEVLKRTQGKGDVAQNARRVIERQTRQMAQLMNDLQDVARATAGKIRLEPRQLDLSHLALRSLDALRLSGRFRHQRLTFQLEPVWVHADPVRMEQVVVNLLTNAAKYTPAGGSIELTLRNDGAKAVLQVRDSGIGIAAGMLPRVFDLFVQGDRTAERRQGGMGLGLALVRKLAELHGGTVQAESEGLNKGSRFTVRLAAIAPQPPVKEQTSLHGCHAVVFGPADNAPLTMESLLCRAGCKVTTVDDPEAALDCIAASRPDFVLVDLAVGGGTASMVEEGVRRAGVQSRLIAIADAGDVAAQSFAVCLRKPLNLQELARLLAVPSEGPLAA